MIINLPVDRGCTLPPRPVTVVAGIIENLTLELHWNAPTIYDVQLGRYNIYGYIGDTEPTDFNQFKLITKVDNTKTSANISVSREYDYVLIASVSTDGAIQKDLSQMVKLTKLSDTLTLADYSWTDIHNISTYRTASDYFAVGDTRSMNINGNPYNIQICGFKHDTKSGGTTKAGITFALANCFGTTRAMHSSGTNNGGWEGSTMYTYLNNTMLNWLPLELRERIKKVDKITAKGGGTNAKVTSSDSLFLFSEKEVTGATDSSYSAESNCVQYELFETTSNRLKKIGDSGTGATYWWTRSPYRDTQNYAFIMSNGSSGAGSPTEARGVCFGFCI